MVEGRTRIDPGGLVLLGLAWHVDENKNKQEKWVRLGRYMGRAEGAFPRYHYYRALAIG